FKVAERPGAVADSAADSDRQRAQLLAEHGLDRIAPISVRLPTKQFITTSLLHSGWTSVRPIAGKDRPAGRAKRRRAESREKERVVSRSPMSRSTRTAPPRP